jgi:hypothetical protein
MQAMDDDDDTGRIKLTKQDHANAAKRAVIESDPGVRITPGMWDALKQRLTRERRRRLPVSPVS